jgi:hypothetical protein
MAALKGAITGFAGANSQYLLEARDKDLAIPDFAGLRSLDYRFDDALDEIVRYGNLNLRFWKEINNILRTAVQLGVAALAAETFHFTDRHSLYTDVAEGIPHIIETKRFYNCRYKLHSIVLRRIV